MASFVITIENVQPNPLTPLGSGQSDRTAALQAVENILKGLEGGETPVTAGGPPTVTFSSTTALGTATATFAGPLTVADTISIGGQALTVTKTNATGTVTLAAPVAGDTLSLNNEQYLFVANTNTPADVVKYSNPFANRLVTQLTFFPAAPTFLAQIQVPLNVLDGTGTITAMTNTQLAAWISSTSNLDTAVNGAMNSTAAAAVITLRAVAPGLAGNSLPLTSSNNTRMAVVAFSGGILVTPVSATGSVTIASPIAGDTITVNGITYSFSATIPAYRTLALSAYPTNAALAAAVAQMIGSDASSAVTANANGTAVVGLTSTLVGAAGNATTLTSSSTGARLVTSGATLAGGSTPATNIFDPGLTGAQAQANFTAAVNASPTAAVSGQVLAYASGPNVTTLKARALGAGGTVALAKTSTNTTLSGATIAIGQLSSGTVVNL